MLNLPPRWRIRRDPLDATEPGGTRHAPSPAGAPPAPFAACPVLLVAAVAMLVTLLASALNSYFGDELYFLVAGYHLDWGYADQQPAVPLLARLMDTLLPGSPLVLRLPSIAVTGLGVVVAALIARELGGDGRAQVLTAGVYALCPHVLAGGRLLATLTFDPFCWTVLTWLLVRWVRLHSRGRPDDRLLLWIGLVTAVAIQIKFLVLGFWAVVGFALLVVGPRRVLLRPMLWAGAAIAAVSAIPTLRWQAEHNWPQRDMQGVIRGEGLSGLGLVPEALGAAGAVGAVLLCFGLLRLFRAPELRPYRFLGVAFLVLAGMFVVVGAREYYLVGLYAVLWAAGAVGLRWTRAFALVALPALAVATVLSVSVLTPAELWQTPTSRMIAHTSSGWREFSGQVAGTLDRVPRDTPVVVADYWSASAFRYFHPDRPVYSASRGYWYFGRPSEGTRTVVAIGGTRESLSRHFSSVRRMSTIDTLGNLPDERPVWIAEGPKQRWSELWPELRRMSMFG